MKTVFKVLIGIAVVALAYLCYTSIATPVKFDKIQKQREELIAKKLKEIASYEMAYKTVNGKFANADELTNFLENGKLFYIIAEGDYTDEMRDKGITEKQAAAQGLIKRDTVLVSAKDSLLRDTPYKTSQEILSVPGFPNNSIEINTGEVKQYIGQDTINISVFEACVPMSVYLGDLNEKQRTQTIEAAMKLNNGKGYPGLKIGSLEELKLTGNWE
ncbi:hypothetical protein HMPREF1869_01058 [Bacteroidales bacterium KA00251]|nr:hypothetical protein HMPREF1869_01058 [Bacteroidales bacterium KA00251]